MVHLTLFQRTSRILVGLVFLAGLSNIAWTIFSTTWSEQLPIQGGISFGVLGLSIVTVVWVWIAEQRLHNSVLAFIGGVGSTTVFCLANIVAPVIFLAVHSIYLLYTQFAYYVMLIILFSHTPVLSLSGYRRHIQRFGLILSIVLNAVMIGFLLQQFGRAYVEGAGAFVVGMFAVLAVVDAGLFIWLPQVYEHIAKSTAQVKYTEQQKHKSQDTPDRSESQNDASNAQSEEVDSQEAVRNISMEDINDSKPDDL